MECAPFKVPVNVPGMEIQTQYNQASAHKIKRMFKKILIANRGEIARRINATAQRMGIQTVAVFSEADANALHVTECDESVCLGPAQASQSYLNIDKVISAAKSTGAKAIHPGYGFLSENAEFAKACARAGIVFIGPPADAIEIMGNKSQAKACALQAKVPLIPGYFGQDQSLDTLRPSRTSSTE